MSEGSKEKVVRVKSEDEIGHKIDRCLGDSLLKTGTGLAVGVVASVILFKRRSWPVWLSTGVGMGMAYSNCQHDLNTPFALHGRKVLFEVRAADVGEPAANGNKYLVVVDTSQSSSA